MLMANSSAIITDAFPVNQRGLGLGLNMVHRRRDPGASGERRHTGSDRRRFARGLPEEVDC
jgi:hypothetical protein